MASLDYFLYPLCDIWDQLTHSILGDREDIIVTPCILISAYRKYQPFPFCHIFRGCVSKLLVSSYSDKYSSWVIH